MTDLRPLLEPFLIRTSVPPSDTLKPDIDFDPLSRHTTRAMLCDAIHSRCPGVTIRQDARVDQVLVLYKAHVDPDLVLPFSKEFSCKPKTLAAGKAHKKTIEFLRFSLQCHAPYIFVHSVGLVHPVLVDLYIKFVCEEDVPEGRVISGYHYSQVSDLMPSVDMQDIPHCIFTKVFFSMAPRRKQAGHVRRIVCCCKAFHCSSGVYLDAYGQQQSGVELTREAYEVHQRAELRNQAQESSLSTNSNIEGPLLEPSGGSDQDDLVTSLAQISLQSSSIRTTRDHLNVNESSNPLQESQVVGTPRPESGERLDINPKCSFSNPNRSTSSENTEATPSRTCLAAVVAQSEGVKKHDCSRFHKFTLTQVPALALHAVLTTVIMNIYDHSSNSTASWLLNVQRITIELSWTLGLVPCLSQSSRVLLPAETVALRKIPKGIGTAINWLEIDPDLIYMNCCRACFALHPPTNTPMRCNHKISTIPGGPIENNPDMKLVANL
ncbi:uncharacterized protein MELLADRAFT_95819 [Melampsora larici-populina 98AG31]|uniref:Uncharacterized protein n=1 Tax=Melampsora larici-populina (strain 98AG31 / pathotype 3-4-7) TaxID=747676 RepID=F4RDC3_MELLP|nr:uncharacterized protein MELLADRAFT_95819 [Melampsora larici-populina 98AG31]EGG09632.1 hypothetical protein MELLADRAFT_95819 [Melampsora larici-populina 98AG31]